MSQSKSVLDVLTELRRNLVLAIEAVQYDRGLKNYPMLARDFRETAGLVRDQVSGLQTAVLQAGQVGQENRPLSRKERLGMDRDDGSW